MKGIIIFSIIAVSLQNIFAQQFSKAIEDNSFYIEEAYNQESHVVQHIFNGYLAPDPDKILQLSFTQEWPVLERQHQLSITIPYSSDLHNVNGFGDMLLNYRYQLIDREDIAMSPRFSLIVPTGDSWKRYGNGVVGIQINVPLSHRWNNEFISHYNAGGTILPKAKLSDTFDRGTLTSYFAGTSLIYLANPSFNIMMEILFTSTGVKGRPRADETIVNPGVRYAINIDALQIVPGIAFPQTLHRHQKNNSGLFLYLSFEHPY